MMATDLSASIPAGHRPVPRWFARFAQRGLKLLAPVLPAHLLNWLHHAAWFVAIGSLNTLLGYLLFVGLLNGFELSRVLALLLAYVCMYVISFQTFSRWVFTGGGMGAFVRFAPSQALLYLCNQGLLELFVRASGWSEELCQFLLLPIVALLSYGFNRVLVFRTMVNK